MKMTTRYSIFGLGFLSLLLYMGMASSQLEAAAARDPEVHFFNEFFGDFSEELSNAKENNKKAIMIFFQQDECPFCYRMKTTILNRPEVQDYFRNNFLLYQVDIDGDIEITDFEGNAMKEKDFAFKGHRVRATPVIAFFDLSGKRVVKYIGATSSVEEFMWLGEFVTGEHYKNSKFTGYKRMKKKATQGK